MGYVFDALNRADGDGPAPDPKASPAKGQTAAPVPPPAATPVPPVPTAPPSAAAAHPKVAVPNPAVPDQLVESQSPDQQVVEELQRQTAHGALAELERTQALLDELNELAQLPAPQDISGPAAMDAPLPTAQYQPPQIPAEPPLEDLPVLEFEADQTEVEPAPPTSPTPAAPARPTAAPATKPHHVHRASRPSEGAPASPRAHLPEEPAATQPPTLPFDSVLGHFDPSGGVRLDDRLMAATDPMSIMAEEYRSIRTGILARWQQKRHLVHLITSATPQEGKTITSLNLGMSFAELRGRRTIVIEADLRLPQFGALLGLPQGPGLIDVLEETTDVSRAITRLPGQGLYVLPAGGRAVSQAVQLLSNAPMTTLLKRLRQEFDHIIIDTPPVVQLADAGILGALSDDVLMVVRLGKTPTALVEQAVRTLASYNAPVAGLIATDQHHYGHRYHYKYEYRYYVRRNKKSRG